jgi:hypothetical protein
MAITKNFNIDDNSLLTEGFKNDTTPLDADNLNTLIDGIKHNRDSIKNLEDTCGNTASGLTTEITNRQDKDKKFSQATFGSETLPTDIDDDSSDVSKHSLQKQVNTLKSAFESLDNTYATDDALSHVETKIQQMIWGTNSPPTDGDYIKRQIGEVDEKRSAGDSSICWAAFGNHTAPPSIDDSGTDTTKHSLKKKIETLDSSKAPKNNPQFSGTPTAPTASITTNNTQIATTAFVRNAISKYGGSGGGTSGTGEAVVYLSTKEHIARNLELQDVYPVQHPESTLSVVATNRMEYYYDRLPFTTNGVTISVETDGSLSVSGKATLSINQNVDVGEVNITPPGKYTLYTNNQGIGHESGSTKKCYPMYTLLDDKGNAVRPMTKLLDTITIDTEELNCSRILISMSLSVNTNASFNDTYKQIFKIAIQSGEKVEKWTSPNAHSNLAGKTIYVYGRNLFNPKSASINEIEISKPIKLNGSEVGYITEPDMYYFKGEMDSDYQIVYSDSGTDRYIQTPLVKGDKFTLIYNVHYVSSGYAYARDVQIVYGHTDYSVYEDFNVSSVTSQSGGICDIDVLQYPYSFLSIDTDTTEDYSIYLRYDPALSRNWTEKQLEKIDNRLDYIEEHGSGGSNDIVVSETEPTVTNHTIWLQPLTTDTGAIDYIIEQWIGDNLYYEKWNNGVVKYYLTEVVDSPPENTYYSSIVEIPVSVCSKILNHTISISGGATDCAIPKILYTYNNGPNVASEYKISVPGATTSVDFSGLTLMHTIIGFWK